MAEREATNREAALTYLKAAAEAKDGKMALVCALLGIGRAILDLSDEVSRHGVQ